MASVQSSTPLNLLTRKEAASKLRISLPSLDKLISGKKLPSINIGKKRLIKEADIEGFIQKGGAK